MGLNRTLFSGISTLILGLSTFSSSAALANPTAGGRVLDHPIPRKSSTLNPDLPTRIVVRAATHGLYGAAGSPSASMMQTRIESSTGIEADIVKQNGEYQVFSFDRQLSAAELDLALDQIRGLDGVAEVFEDIVAQAVQIPGDPYISIQSTYYGSGAGGMNLPAAWDVTTGDPNLRVAILDTGKTNHPDLAGRWLEGYDFVDLSCGKDGDGWDPDPTDPGDNAVLASSSWHGSHVAGIFGANANNGMGIAGVNWQSGIVPVRVLGVGGGYISDIADAISWAAGLPVTALDSTDQTPPDNLNPARVINLSLGAKGACSSNLQGAVNDAVAAGSIVVVAAGNDAVDMVDFVPANCANVITVGAVDNVLPDISSYSNYGEGVTISAPGNNILSSVISTDGVTPVYKYKNGTSMATPHVTGVISLMLSVNPVLGLEAIVDILTDTARPFPPEANPLCLSGLCGAGIIDASAAVQAVPRVAMVSPEEMDVTRDTTVTLSGFNFDLLPDIELQLVDADTLEFWQYLDPAIQPLEINSSLTIYLPANTLSVVPNGSYRVMMTWQEPEGWTNQALSPTIVVTGSSLDEPNIFIPLVIHG